MPVIAAAVAALVLVVAIVAAVVGVTSSSSGAPPGQVAGISPIVLDAYLRAAAATPKVAPSCKDMTWAILAGIGKIESNHLAVRHITPHGDVHPPFYGPRLDGSGVGGNTTPFHDTDNGRLDGDTVYDRAVGLMQFIPSTWGTGGYSGPQGDGRDGNGDGTADPHNVYDSALAAVVHLCGKGRVNLADRGQLAKALYRYNHSKQYVSDVLREIDHYAQIGQQPAAFPLHSSGRGATVVRAALRWLGTPYSWGGGTTRGPSHGFGRGAGIKGFDCSGLTLYAWAQAGVRIPRVAADQWRAQPHVRRGQEQPGDLVFFIGGLGTRTNPGHVGIIIRPGKMIEAPYTGQVVRVANANRNDLVGYARPGG